MFFAELIRKIGSRLSENHSKGKMLSLKRKERRKGRGRSKVSEVRGYKGQDNCHHLDGTDGFRYTHTSVYVSNTCIYVCMYLYVYNCVYIYICIYRIYFGCISGVEQRIGAFFLSVSELTVTCICLQTKGKHRWEWKAAMDLILWIN